MADFPGPGYPPPFLHTWSRYSGVWELSHTATSLATASITWATGDVIRYVPMSLPWAYPVRRVFWLNGSSVAGNVEFGIYTLAGVRLYSTGTQTMTGASVPQVITPTTFILPPGDYMFALVYSGTTNKAWGNAVAAAQMQFAGIKQQASATLPAVATYATPTVAGVGLCGVTWTTAGF